MINNFYPSEAARRSRIKIHKFKFRARAEKITAKKGERRGPKAKDRKAGGIRIGAREPSWKRP